jgi:nicotinamide riboside transporter PnuC
MTKRFHPIDFVLVFFGLIGAVLNIKQSIWGFIIWTPTNIGLIILHFRRGYYEQAVLFIAYTILSLWGIWEWR